MQPAGAVVAVDHLERPVARNLAARWPTLPKTATCTQVFDFLEKRVEQAAVAIVDDDGRVAGLVTRLTFLASYAQRYYPELYGREPALALANTSPLVVDENMPVAEVGAMLVLEKPNALTECFIVTSAGRYLGVGTGEALMRCKVALLQSSERELGRALGEAQRANQTKSNFLALMSHEFRTPLNAIIGFSEILNQGIFGPLGSARYAEYAGDIHSAARHLLSLINDILDVSKAEAGKIDLHCEPVELPDLIDECMKLVAVRARESGLALVVKCQPGPSQIHADRMRLKQVILNLLSNAVKFTPSGGEVTVGAGYAGGCNVEIFVRDTGIGMTKEQIPLALQPFRQLGQVHARKFEGTGLGLTLAKKLVELHDGTIRIESAPDAGTTVFVRLPISGFAGRAMNGDRDRLALAG